jgi:hypothetical protein
MHPDSLMADQLQKLAANIASGFLQPVVVG